MHNSCRCNGLCSSRVMHVNVWIARCVGQTNVALVVIHQWVVLCRLKDCTTGFDVSCSDGRMGQRVALFHLLRLTWYNGNSGIVNSTSGRITTRPAFGMPQKETARKINVMFAPLLCCLEKRQSMLGLIACPVVKVGLSPDVCGPLVSMFEG